MRGITAAFAVLLASSAGPAHADEATNWYGWQIMAVDAAGFSAIAAGSQLEGRPATGLVVGGYLVLAFGGGVVHRLNERDLGIAGASVGVRAFGTLLAGITLLGGVSGHAPSMGISRGRWLLASTFVAAALLVDWFLLANPPDPEGVGQSFGASFSSTF
jgi:hypothetical protein